MTAAAAQTSAGAAPSARPWWRRGGACCGRAADVAEPQPKPTCTVMQGAEVDSKPQAAATTVHKAVTWQPRPSPTPLQATTTPESKSPSRSVASTSAVASTCAAPLALESATAPHIAEAVLEMCCDWLCVRTMRVTYVDGDGRRRECTGSGYNVKVFLPQSPRDVEVRFTVVGGGPVRRVNRSRPDRPWVKDAQGGFLPEMFTYPSPPEHTQFFLRGSSLHSYVESIDERKRSQSLLELMSKDFLCVRSMCIEYTDEKGERQQFTGTGYSVKCHLASSARDVHVTFGAVGGSAIRKVDRCDPKCPWVRDANGQRPRETFFYSECPPCVQYEVCGPVWGAHIFHVHEQHVRWSCNDAAGAGATARPHEDTREVFDVAPDAVPPVGGIVDLKQPHSEYLLPAQVLLFEPSAGEIFHRGNSEKRGARLLFLNTPLTDRENAALLELRELLVRRGVIASATDPLPRYMATHALRMLQICKFNASKAADMMMICVAERVRRLPIAEEDVIDVLRTGFIYWHGRDRKGRPCLVLRFDRLGPVMRDKEHAVRACIFTLEYALRFAMVPGRVENWVVIGDLQNCLSILSPFQIGAVVSTAAAIAVTLEKLYCGRMVWVKIINVPGSSILTKAINSTIPSDKKDKIEFPLNAATAFAEHFEPNQLESRYGGTAPNTAAGETYPFRFFTNPLGRALPDYAKSRIDGPGASAAEERSSTRSAEGGPCLIESSPCCGPSRGPDGAVLEDLSMHECATLAFHEGQLWDESSAQARARWAEEAATACPLAPEAAAALGGKLAREVLACRSVTDWMTVVNPKAVGTGCATRARSLSSGVEGVVEEEDVPRGTVFGL